MTLPLSRLLSSAVADDQTVALRGGKPINFARFRADIASVAADLANCRRGALVCQDSYHFMVGFFGLLHAGSRILFPPNATEGRLDAVGEPIDLLVDDAVIARAGHRQMPLAPLDASRPSLDFFTSGSSGAPKRIEKNLAVLEAEIAVLDGLWGQREGAVFATVTHQHIYGLTFKLLWPLAAGRPFTTAVYSLWEDLLADLTPNAVIISGPAHLARLDGITPLPHALRPQRVFSAGASLSAEASAKAEAILGVRPTEIFGSTETGAIATRSGQAEDEPWRLLPGTAMQCDEQGRLRLLSPFIGPDWLTTNDLVAAVAEGFHFRGRADRIVKIEGKRVSLVEVEEALQGLPEVKAVSVALLAGKPERLVAVVVPSEDGHLILSKVGKFRFGRLLRRAMAPRHEPASLPRLWRFVDEMPVQGMGKPRQADILALFREEI